MIGPSARTSFISEIRSFAAQQVEGEREDLSVTLGIESLLTGEDEKLTSIARNEAWFVQIRGSVERFWFAVCRSTYMCVVKSWNCARKKNRIKFAPLKCHLHIGRKNASFWYKEQFLQA